MAEEQDKFISEFMGVAGVEDDEVAKKFGAAHDWDLQAALASFYAANDESEPTENEPSTAPDTYTGPRTLGGAPAPEYQASTKQQAAKKKGLATLSSLGGSGSSHDHAHDKDDDDDDDDGRGDLYAGGEKSGLSVQDPRTGPGPSSTKKVIADILAKARQDLPRDGEDEEQAGPSRSNFRGTGQTLGGEGEESRTIPDPSGPSSNEPTQVRILHLWLNGFSIDDGDLRRFDNPENARELAMIQAGQAPLHLMNLRFDQPVDVHVEQHQEEYREPYRPFAGEGRRLGSPVADPSSGAPTTSIAAAVATAAPAAAAPILTVDESQPTLTIRIQLPDGTRLPARFNTTHTVGDVYDFVQRGLPSGQGRAWVLATTFPNKEHSDKALVLGEMPEFKRGGAAVVKWAT